MRKYEVVYPVGDSRTDRSYSVSVKFAGDEVAKSDGPWKEPAKMPGWDAEIVAVFGMVFLFMIGLVLLLVWLVV